MKSVVFCLLACICFNSVNITAQKSAFQINRELGKGINFGNIFEAPKENEWGNPFRDDYPKRIKSLGFDHIRIPIRWDTPERTMQTTPFTITPAFLSRIKYVVDLAIKENLKVIINMHHHDEIFTNPAGAKPRFLSQWNQIATYFKDYSDLLLFEVMNEPHDKLTPELWNEYFADALKEIRKTNPVRAVLMGTAEFGGVSGINKLVVPKDPYVIVTVHYYNPFPFTHQGASWVGTQSNDWLGTKWNDTAVDRDALKSEIQAVVNFSKNNNVPVHMGEFGAFDRADMASRVRWTTFLARYFESLGFSWAYWEWSAGFGIFRPADNSYNQALADALLKNQLPEPTKVILKTVYSSNFTNSVDGWFLSTSSGASGSLSSLSGDLNVNINTVGTQSWHVQMSKGGFRIEKDKTYKLSIECKSSNNNSFTYYAGKASDPWNSYSGYPSANVSNQFQEYSTVFTMAGTTDNSARIAFDMGGKAGSFQIKSIRLEEVTLDFTSSFRIENNENSLRIYPNPSNQSISFDIGEMMNDSFFIKIFDAKGRIVKEFSVIRENKIDISDLNSGEYILQVADHKNVTVSKFVKK